MTTEEKAKAYDEIIKKANKMYSENCEACKACLEELIPELREGSEDERIRKALITYFSDEDESYDGIPYPSILAWLEKQSKASKVEQAMREVEEKAKAFTESHKGETSEEILAQMRGEQKPSWSEDVKRMFIKALERVEEQNSKGYKLTDCDKNSWWEDFKAYTSCIVEQKPVDKVEPKFNIGDKIIGIISGMQYYITEVRGDCYYTESGCIIMFCAQNNFELVNQKPAWSEEDEIMFRKAIITIDNVRMNTDSSEYYQGICNWFISLKDRVGYESDCTTKQEWKQENIEELSDFENVMMHIGDSFFGPHAGLDPNDTNTIKEQATILLELVPKQEWGTIDEKVATESIDMYESEVKELEDVKTKQEWSDEDEVKINRIASCLENLNVADNDILLKDVDWLKSLRPQLQWKPNQTILDSLEIIINHPDRMTDYNKNNLIRLLEQLKKLKG